MKGLTSLLLFVMTAVHSDGQWTVYDPSNSGISNNTVRAVKADSSRNGVWSGTDNGLNFFDGANWTNYLTSNSGIPGNLIESISIDPDNNIWIGTRTSGVGVFNGSSWVVLNTANSALPDNEVNDIGFFGDEVWFATAHGLAVYDSSLMSWQVWDVSNSPLWSNHMLSIDFNDSGHTYTGTLNGGLVVLNDTGMVILHGSVQGFPENTIRKVDVDQNGVAWCSTPTAGVISVFPDYSWAVFNGDNTLLPTNGTTSLIIKNNTSYITTIDNGLVKLQGGLYTVYDSASTGLPEDFVVTIDIDKNDIIWLGTNQSGLVRFDEILGVHEANIKENKLHVYPNPIHREDNYELTFSTPVSGQISIYDGLGRLVWDKTVSGQSMIHLSELDPGIYYLSLNNGRWVSSKILIR